MSEAKQRLNEGGAISRRQILQGGLAAGILAVTPLKEFEADGKSRNVVQSNTLFPTGLPHGEFVNFEAEGFSAPVVGVIHRREYPALCGVPLGGIGTGCLDLDTSGLFGLCSIFNSHAPRRGAMNWPFLGLYMNGQTWVLTTGQQSPEKGSGHAANEPRPPDLVLPGVKMAKNIHFWGHYPVTDMEFETDAPVSLGMRAWSPLIPGDAALSNTPGAVFEVHLRNKTEAVQSGTLAFSFFGPSYDEGWTWKFKREVVESPVQGVHVTSRLSNYVLGAVGKRAVRTGGAMGESPEVRFRPKPDPANWAKAWANLGRGLPPTSETESGASVAVDFHLDRGAEDTIRFVLAWYSPHWMSSGSPTNGPRSFRHMYSTRHANALSVAELLVDRHAELLPRILAWQQEIYSEETLPKWLREVLLNMLHTYTESGFWAAAEMPVGEWCRPEDGLFAICESPRTCAQMECLPVTFFGTLPLVYFFPQLALSTLRAEKTYQFENGAPAMIMGGVGSWSGGPELASPDIGYQVVLNPTVYITIVDRFRMLHHDETFVREFYPSVKRAVEFMVGLNRGPDGVVSMPDHLASVWPGVPYETEWLEWGRWVGIVPHVGGLHISTLAIAERMAREVGDNRFAQQCREWFEVGSTTLETKTWLGSYYLRYFNPETGERSDDIAACQLDGQLVARMHGLRDVFRVDRIPIALETIKQTCVAATKLGTVLYASPTGTASEGGASMMFSYPATETFMQVIIPLGLMYIYAGQRELGLEIMRRAFHNCICRQGLSWYGENSFDAVTGKHLSGSEYVTRMFLWGTIAALQNKDLSATTQRGGLVERILKASQATVKVE
ncbi:MAG TPA: GH116 family glycosyl-hydrolase [Terriglobales bacterium]|nr:GH116 family glycosyl-hydrolase [Terriglobales bacterium]